MYQIFTKPNCPACLQAKALLQSKGLSFEEIHLDFGQPIPEGARRMAVTEFKATYPNQRTAPMILCQGPDSAEVVGGVSELQRRLAQA